LSPVEDVEVETGRMAPLARRHHCDGTLLTQAPPVKKGEQVT